MTKSELLRQQGSRASGFSLIEVLVALLILSFGLLGFALLQTLSVRFSQAANYRTVATNLAYELFDQMRANRADRQNYPGYASFSAGAVVKPQGGCIPGMQTQSAQAMANLWKCQVVQTLGEKSSAAVTYQNGNVIVTLSWPERTGENPSVFSVKTAL